MYQIHSKMKDFMTVVYADVWQMWSHDFNKLKLPWITGMCKVMYKLWCTNVDLVKMSRGRPNFGFGFGAECG